MSDEEKPTSLDKLKARFGNNLQFLETGAFTGQRDLFEALTIINGVDSIDLDDMKGSDSEKQKIRDQAMAPSEAMAMLFDKYIRALISGDSD
jgi:hypothetical protein